MKKKIMALILVVALAVSAMSILAVQAANGIEVVADGSKFTVKITGTTTSDKDWVGIYKEGETTDPNNGGATSLIWWYIGETTKTVNWPADKEIADATNGTNSTTNRTAELNEDFTLKPGKYYAIVLANDGYAELDGFEKVAFEIK